MTHSTQTGPNSGAIFVLESEPFLVPELQRQFAGEPITVQSIRPEDDPGLSAAPCVCVLAIESDGTAAMRLIRSVQQHSGTACVVVAPGRDEEWMLREMGAACVIDSFIRGDELAAICRKLLRSLSQREQKHETHV